MPNYWPNIIDGTLTTLTLSFVVLLFTTILGVINGFLCSTTIRPITFIFRFINNLVKTLPLMLVLLFCYYGLTFFTNIKLSIFTASALGLTISATPYFTETFILLFSHQQSPKITNFIPAYFTNFAMIVRDSSLASILALAELISVGRRVAEMEFDYSIFLVIAAIYMLIGIILIYIGKWLAIILTPSIELTKEKGNR